MLRQVSWLADRSRQSALPVDGPPVTSLIAKSALTVAGAAPALLRVAQTTGFPLSFQDLADLERP
jgi:hypothetical protein